MNQHLKFRPHHFLCTVGFQGKGYSDEFVENYTKIADSLRSGAQQDLGDNTLIQVVHETDSICAPCPNRRGSVCETESKISRLDRAHEKILGIKAGDCVTWGEAKSKIKEHFTLDNFKEACAPCSWLKTGMCEKALKKLKGISALFLITLGFALVSSDAHASKKSSTLSKKLSARTPSSQPQTKKIEKISSSLKALNRAYEAWEKRDSTTTIREAKTVTQDPIYADHALALLSYASLYESEKRLESKNSKSALSLAQAAADGFEKIREKHLYSPWWGEAARGLAQAELALGSAYARAKNWKKSVSAFETAFQRIAAEGGSYLITASHLDAYSERCKKAETSICRAWVVKFANTYSKNSAESRVIGKFFPDIIELAKPNFANSKVTTGYKQKDSDDLAFDEAFKSITSEEWSDSIDAFRKFLDEFPRSASRFRAKYWLAHALDKKGKGDEAKKLWSDLYQETPLTHYGILSSWKIQKSIEARFSEVTPETTSEDPFQTPIEAARSTRIKALIQAKAYGLAAKDLRTFRPRDTASGAYLLYLAEISNLTGSHLTAFTVLSDLIQRADESVYSKRILDFVFPTPDWSLIQKISKDQELDPILVLSLIKQESAFEREAQSSVGASGYMQLMPFTASDVEPEIQRRDLLIPENNIRIGTKYLKKVLQKFNGNIALALAGYNAGPNAVDRWMKEGRANQGVLEFIEQIPYKETRDYVGTIFRNYVWYKRRLENQTITDVSDFWRSGNASPNPSIQVVSTSSSRKTLKRATPQGARRSISSKLKSKNRFR